MNTLKQRIQWALTKPICEFKNTPELTIKQQKTQQQDAEKRWGNLMINQVNNGQMDYVMAKMRV